MSNGQTQRRISATATAFQCNITNMNILSLWIFGLLFISSSGTHVLSSIPENFVLAKEDKGPVTLTCNSTPGTAITWKLNNDPIDNLMFRTLLTQNDQHLILSGVDFSMLGNYSCWSEGRALSSVYLLFEIEEPDSALHCWARSYDCIFNCKWKKGTYSAVRVGLGEDCTKGLKSCQWVTSGVQVHGGGFQFQLSHSLSPYAEENTRLEVTVEAINYHSLVRKIKKFFLRDIIQPNSPKIVKCEEVGQNLKVTIKPPSNWSTPHSFFSLEHQIHYRLKDNNQDEFTSSTLIPEMASSLRVRSRDSLVQSTWSEWSPWKNVNP